MNKLESKAQRWSRIIGALPGVVAVFLSGSIAQGRSSEQSDIDFFIIAYPGKIWTARFLTNLVLKLTFNLSKPAHHQGRICPNHFITADSLEIEEQDAYSAHLFSHNKPLYDPFNQWALFVEANAWVQVFKEAFPVLLKSEQTVIPKRFKAHKMKLDFIERALRWLQQQKIYRNPEFKLKGAKIVLRSTELRFHPEPKNKDWASETNVDLGKQARQASVEIVTRHF